MSAQGMRPGRLWRTQQEHAPLWQPIPLPPDKTSPCGLSDDYEAQSVRNMTLAN